MSQAQLPLAFMGSPLGTAIAEMGAGLFIYFYFIFFKEGEFKIHL